MHISQMYLSTYQQHKPITGSATVTHEETIITVKFNEEECAAIQNIAVKAYERQQRAAANIILNNTPALTALPPPEPEADEAEFEEILPHNDEVQF